MSIFTQHDAYLQAIGITTVGIRTAGIMSMTQVYSKRTYESGQTLTEPADVSRLALCQSLEVPIPIA